MQQFLWVKSLVVNEMVAVRPGSGAVGYFVTNLRAVLQQAGFCSEQFAHFCSNNLHTGLTDLMQGVHL